MAQLGVGISVARPRRDSSPSYSGTVSITALGTRYVGVAADLECTATGDVDYVVWTYDIGAGEVTIDTVLSSPWTASWTPTSDGSTTIRAHAYAVDDSLLDEDSAVVDVGYGTIEITALGTRYVGVAADLECTVTGAAVAYVVWRYNIGAGPVEIETVSSAPWTSEDWTPGVELAGVETTITATAYAADDTVLDSDSAVITPRNTLESCVRDGTLQVKFDATSGYVPEVGGVAANWTPSIGGTAADVLVGVLGNEPVRSASDAGFGGRPSVTGDGVKGMVSATPGSAVTIAQPGWIVIIGRNHTPVSAAIEYIVDGTGTDRWILDKVAGNVLFNAYAGSNRSTGSEIVAEERNIITIQYNGASTVFRKRNSDGAVFASGALNVGTNALQGLSLFATSTGSFPSGFGGTAVLLGSGTISAEDQARLDEWCQLEMSWT